MRRQAKNTLFATGWSIPPSAINLKQPNRCFAAAFWESATKPLRAAEMR